MVRYYQDFNLLPLDMQKDYKEGNIKLKQSIVPRSRVYDVLQGRPNALRNLEIKNNELEKKGSVWRYQLIPCQNCWACNMNYSAEWATRIMYECQKTDHNYFITLTYDDEHLPIASKTWYNGTTYENDGTWEGTLDPKDMDKFINSLRKYFERKGHTGIKYYYCGEYGTTTYRPHHHLILMKCPLDIEQFYDCHIDGRYKEHWKSHEIERFWKNGMIDIGEVEWASAAYVARYCMKKIFHNTTKERYFEEGKYPEYVRMSRRPGIGMDYYREHVKDIYKYDEINVKNFHGMTITVKPPKAWDRKFKEQFPEEYENLKLSRQKAADRANQIKREMTDMTDLQMLELKAQEVIRKGKLLPREV